MKKIPDYWYFDYGKPKNIKELQGVNENEESFFIASGLTLMEAVQKTLKMAKKDNWDISYIDLPKWPLTEKTWLEGKITAQHHTIFYIHEKKVKK